MRIEPSLVCAQTPTTRPSTQSGRAGVAVAVERVRARLRRGTSRAPSSPSPSGRGRAAARPRVPAARPDPRHPAATQPGPSSSCDRDGAAVVERLLARGRPSSPSTTAGRPYVARPEPAQPPVRPARRRLALGRAGFDPALEPLVGGGHEYSAPRSRCRSDESGPARPSKPSSSSTRVCADGRRRVRLPRPPVRAGDSAPGTSSPSRRVGQRSVLAQHRQRALRCPLHPVLRVAPRRSPRGARGYAVAPGRGSLRPPRRAGDRTTSGVATHSVRRIAWWRTSERSSYSARSTASREGERIRSAAER